MIIEWFGHSFFSLRSESNTVILIDPYDSTVGYEQPKLSCDCVLMTHQHDGHNAADEVVLGKCEKISAPGQYTVGNAKIYGYETFHDKSEGADRGKNIIYKVVMDGASILHLGDLAHVLSDELVEELGSIDVLMIPVGGTFTIDAKEALEIIDKLTPNMILPMHYLTDRTDKNIAPIHAFTDLANVHYDVSRTGRNSIVVDKRDMKKRTRIFLLEYM